MTTTPSPTIHDLFNLAGKTALITGGTGWLGAAMAAALAEAGASVVIASSRGRDAADKAARNLPGPASHHAVVLNYRDEASIQRGFDEAVNITGRVDILVNNGLETIPKDLTDITQKEFEHHVAQNAGWFELARLVRNHAVENNRGASIIMIGSMYGLVASYADAYEGVCTASPVAYHALKGGTIQMTRHLAAYWARDNVRVNCLNPGPFPSAKAAPEMVRRLTEKCPMKRMGQPWELKGAVVFLASQASSYMTGQSLTLDGGWTAW